MNHFAQGELYFRAIPELPTGLTLVEPVNGQYIVGHSETGHHHVVDAPGTTMYADPKNRLMAFLVVTAATSLRHLRPHDTHASVALNPGTVWEVRRQREYVPGGWAQVAD